MRIQFNSIPVVLSYKLSYLHLIYSKKWQQKTQKLDNVDWAGKTKRDVESRQRGSKVRGKKSQIETVKQEERDNKYQHPRPGSIFLPPGCLCLLYQRPCRNPNPADKQPSAILAPVHRCSVEPRWRPVTHSQKNCIQSSDRLRKA